MDHRLCSARGVKLSSQGNLWLRGAGEADLGGSWHHGIRAFMASQAHDTRCFLATRALSFASCYWAQSTCGSAWADGGPHRGACALPKSQMRVTGASLGREIHTQYSRKGTTWWKWHKNRGSNIIEYVTVFVNLDYDIERVNRIHWTCLEGPWVCISRYQHYQLNY